MFFRKKLLAAALLAASAAAVTPASADPTFTLTNLTFTDGGTANGSFTYSPTFNVFYNVLFNTTAGGLINPGITYDSSINNSTNVFYTGLPAGVAEIIQINSTTYAGYLQLAFQTPITTSIEPLVLSASFECSGFAGGSSVGTCGAVQRNISSPGSTLSAVTVPEPASLSLLGFGLLAAGYMFSRHRKQQLTAV